MSVLGRTMLTLRRRAGGILAVVGLVGAVLGAGTATLAAPAQQAATATPAPAPPACVAAPQGVQIVLGNPQPGDTLLTGVPVVMSGIAYDVASTAGSGIASVTVFLNDRDAGGIWLGTALLGQANPQASAGSQFATSGFTLRTPALPNGSGGRSIFVYARSSITDLEAVLEVPIFLNTAPTPVKGQVPTPVLTPPAACTPVPIPAATPTPTSTALPALG